LKAVPMTYGRDLQEDKEALFDAAVTARGALRALTAATNSLDLRAERAAARAGAGYSTATDLADYLVRKGVPFRTAYEAVKRLILDASAAGTPLHALDAPTLSQAHPAFREDALAAATPARSVAARAIPGGTAPSMVHAALSAAEDRLAAHRVALTASSAVERPG